jgi:hypothetical protein
MTTIVPDLITTNFDKFSFQKTKDDLEYRTIGQINKEREVINNASSIKKFQFTTKDDETFPYRYVLTGIQELNTFNKLFFSEQNLQWLHSNIRYEVYNNSINNTVISKQRDSDVLESMRRIYLQNSNNPETKIEMKEEILRLNKLVLKDTVPRIVSEITQYKTYLRDIEKIRQPNSLPVNTSVVGTKLYERGPADVLGLEV